MTTITTRFPDITELSEQTIAHIVTMINQAYDVAESGMWQSEVERTNTAQVKQSLSDKTLLVAQIDNTIVGALVVKLMDNQTGEFGSLVSDTNFRNQGIGSALVKAAEQWAVDNQCKTMRLELLTPRGWTHPSKTFLKQWYSSLGYQPKQTEPFEATFPDKVELLATECDFTVWLKTLV